MVWLVYVLLGGTFIGLSSFFRKMATKTSSSLSSFLIEGLVYGVLAFLFFLIQQNKSSIFSHPWYAAFSAVSLFFGAFFLYRAFAIGELSLTNTLYLVASLIAVLVISFAFLREPLTIKQILGIVFGILAIFLLKK